MQNLTSLFKVLSDKSRLRTLLLLTMQELCVCQLIEIQKLSQPLVSRNLNILQRAGFITGKRKGKLVFYKLRGRLSRPQEMLLSIIKESVAESSEVRKDLKNLRRCEEFMSRHKDCDLDKFRRYMRSAKVRLSP